MATATVEITLPGLTGFALSLDLYPLGSDTAAVSGLTLTEATNRNGTYTTTTTAGLSGSYLAIAKEGTTVRGAGYVAMTDTENVHVVGIDLPGKVLGGGSGTISGVGARVVDHEGNAIAQAVWDVLTSGLTTVGSIGKYLVDRVIGTLASGTHQPQGGDAYARLGAPAGASIAADIAALGTGTGAGPNQVNVTVSSSAGGTLQGVSVRMKAAGLGDHTDTTNASGVAQFNLASGSWSLTAALNGYSYAGSTQVVSTNPQPIAITMTVTTVSVPSGPNKSIGTLLCLDSGGDPESGVTVSFQMIAGPGNDGYSLDAEIVEEECDSEGVIEREFLRGATYDAWRGVRGARARFTVPDAASFNLPEHLGVD